MRIAILGTGLIGTSIAMAAARTGDEVSGWDRDAYILARSAQRSGLRPTVSAEDAVEGAELVFVCTPVPALAETAALALRTAPDAVVADAGSVKASIIRSVSDLVPAADLARFVGSHPMGGSERSGPEAASASLLDGAVWVLTPTGVTSPQAGDTLESWITSAGAKPLRMDPVRHDRVVGMVSHLPQVVSTSLMGLAAREDEGLPETLVLAAGGFRDLTRLAASNPGLWAEILLSNREELTGALALFMDELGEMRELLERGDPAALEEALARATEARKALAARPKVRAGVGILQVPIPDRPGALAQLTAALSERSVNIEDLQIIHSPEGGRGTVHLTVAGADLDAATEAAQVHGFEAYRIA